MQKNPGSPSSRLYPYDPWISTGLVYFFLYLCIWFVFFQRGDYNIKIYMYIIYIYPGSGNRLYLERSFRKNMGLVRV